MPALRTLAHAVFDDMPCGDRAAWERTVRTLWRGAKYREERYAAILLARERVYRAHRSPAALPLFEEMTVTGAWWDFVDEIAAHLIGELLQNYPKPLRTTLRRWSRGNDMWKRRSAILAQLRFKSTTDVELLFELIEPSLASNEFFLRKAIGWALRELSKHAPDTVRAYVRARHAQLAPLTRREALKIIGR